MYWQKILIVIIASTLSFKATADLNCAHIFTTSNKITKPSNVDTVKIPGKLSREDGYHLRVTLGVLSKEKFEELKTDFNGSENMKYIPGKVYYLKDFFPKFANIISGKTLKAFDFRVPKKLVSGFKKLGLIMSPDTIVDSLCHSITWQWVNHFQGRGAESPLFFQVDGESLLEFIKSAPQVSKDSLRTGDILTIKGSAGLHQQNVLLHSAVYLGFGLIFEKGNPGADYVYRVAKLSDVLKKYQEVSKDVEFNFLRVKDMKASIPTPVEGLSLLSVEVQNAFFLTGIESLPADLLSRFGVSEEFDFELNKSVFYASPLMGINDVGSNLVTIIPDP